MQLSYGGYRFPINGASTTVRVRTVFADSGRPLRYVASLDVLAYLDGVGQADLTLKENALNAALAIPYQDIALFQDVGTPTGTKLVNSASMSGVRVVDGPNYTNEAKDGEYTVMRTVRFTAEASYLIANAKTAVVSWQESITILGANDPDTVWRTFVNAPPILQQVNGGTTSRLIQTGSAVGYLAGPAVPGPIWPWPIEKSRSRRITRTSPRREGPNSFIEYGASWSYEYESNGPLVAFPNLPPM